MAGEKQLVYCLTDGTTTAIHLDAMGLCDALEMELDNMHQDDALEMNFTITAKLMTEKEIEALPEFDGF